MKINSEEGRRKGKVIMKKRALITILLVIAIFFSLLACGSKQTSDATTEKGIEKAHKDKEIENIEELEEVRIDIDGILIGFLQSKEDTRVLIIELQKQEFIINKTDAQTMEGYQLIEIVNKINDKITERQSIRIYVNSNESHLLINNSHWREERNGDNFNTINIDESLYVVNLRNGNHSKYVFGDNSSIQRFFINNNRIIAIQIYEENSELVNGIIRVYSEKKVLFEDRRNAEIIDILDDDKLKYRIINKDFEWEVYELNLETLENTLKRSESDL